MSIERKPEEPCYEGSEIKVAVVVMFTVALAVACGVLMAGVVWLYGRYQVRERDLHRAVAPATRLALPEPQHPPEPVLQGAPGSLFELQDPLVERVEQREQEVETLSSYGWVDRSRGTVRIPIERAKELLLEQGLPVREPARAVAEAGR